MTSYDVILTTDNQCSVTEVHSVAVDKPGAIVVWGRIWQRDALVHITFRLEKVDPHC